MNEIILSVSISWGLCQIIKLFTSHENAKKFDIKKIYSSGGMPSSHTSAAIALALSTYFDQRGITTIFVITLFIAAYVIHDAIYIRRKSGEHAKALNKILKKHHFDEILGHTPTQGLVGAIIGIIISIGVHLLW